MESIREVDTLYSIMCRTDTPYCDDIAYPAICTSLENAAQLIESNSGNLSQDGYYNWVSIQSISANVVTFEYPEIEIWYKWDVEFGYIRSDKEPPW